jgi:hypothetical protein
MRARGIRAVGTVALVVAASLAIGPGRPVFAHVSQSVDHLWNVHLKPLLATPGTLNSSSNPVDWTKLKGVPSGFADGTDNGITRILAGKGISVKSGFGGPSVSVDLPAYSGFKDSGGIIANDFATVGSLKVPAGSYVIVAKLNVIQPSPAPGGELNLTVECKLQAGGDFDEALVHIVGDDNGGAAGTTAAVPVDLNVVHTFASAANASVICKDADVGDARWTFLKITAFKVSGISNTSL